MKSKINLAKLLTLIMVLTLMLSAMCVPTMAETDARDSLFEPNSGEAIGGDLTDYTMEAFKVDFKNADYYSHIDFEDKSSDASWWRGTRTFETAINGLSQETNLTLNWVPTVTSKDFSKLIDDSGRAVFGTKYLATEDVNDCGTHKMLFTGVASLKPTAIGFFTANNAGDNKKNKIKVSYTDGSSTEEEYTMPNKLSWYFNGFKAPEGQYIESVTFSSSEIVFYDNICLILEKTAESMTEYTMAEFYSDYNAADYKAMVGFEDTEWPSGWQRKSVSLDANIEGETASNIDINWTFVGANDNTTVFYLRDNTANTERIFEGNYSGATEQEKVNTMTFRVDDPFKITSMGFVSANFASAGNTTTYTVNYQDGSSSEVEVTRAIKGNWYFVGFKAPEDKYITSITSSAGDMIYYDNIAFILDDPTAQKDPVFSTDDSGENVISTIGDVASATDIYVTIPVNAQATGKLILAIYDGNGLLDVNVVDESAAQAMVTIPSGKTISKIKMFVWDSITGLNPLEGKAVTID